MENEIRVLDNPKIVRVLACETRVKIIKEIIKEPKSLSQLARIFGISPAAVHYHIKQLEKAGFVKITRTEVVNNNLTEKFYQATTPPSLLCLNVDTPVKGPVPPKKKTTKHVLAIDITEIASTLSSLGLTYPPEKEEQLERNIMKLIEMTSEEAESIYKEILKQLQPKLSPTDRLKIESSIRALFTLTLLRVIDKPQYLETLRSLIQTIRML